MKASAGPVLWASLTSSGARQGERSPLRHFPPLTSERWGVPVELPVLPAVVMVHPERVKRADSAPVPNDRESIRDPAVTDDEADPSWRSGDGPQRSSTGHDEPLALRKPGAVLCSEENLHMVFYRNIVGAALGIAQTRPCARLPTRSSASVATR